MDKNKQSGGIAKNGAKETRDAIRVLHETNANLFNIKCLTVFSVMAVLTELLNELGLFKVERVVMIPSMALAICVFLLPVVVYYIGSKRHSGTPVVERAWFRKLIITCAFVGAGLISISLSFHSIIFLAVPILLAAQYGNRNSTFIGVLIASLLLVPISVYGSYFFGTPDRNFIKGMLTDEQALIFRNRLMIATPKRMVDLFFHYAVPRLLGVGAVAVLASGITRRNSLMSEKQIELSEKIHQEMTERQEMQNHVIELLANVIETRDISTGEHIIHTKQYVGLIAEAMREDDEYRDVMTDEMIERLKNTAPLHDVGKILVPDTILLKPAKLTPEEFERMKTHSASGGQLIKQFFSGIKDVDFLKTAEEIAVSHHEKWDGTGYPEGLRGEDIPLSARIMAVADVFDALVSVRVYKGSIEPSAALGIIYSESGTHFDPGIVRIVHNIEDEMTAIANSNCK